MIMNYNTETYIMQLNALINKNFVMVMTYLRLSLKSH